MLYSDEEIINICELDENNNIKFTKEYLELTKLIGYKAKELAAYLITDFVKENATLLDYFGPEDNETDIFTGQLNGPQDVDINKMELWSIYERAGKNLPGEWYQDLLRSKLISLRVPTKLIKSYIKSNYKDNYGR